MADKGTSDDGPSLEMPTLRLGRRKPPREAEAGPVAPAPAARATVPAASARPRPSLPGLTGVAAALATGAGVGALGVLLVWLASVGCEAARGTASCGGGPGFLVLVAVLALLAYVGALGLRTFGVRDAGSTSLLAVGVMAVLVLVLFTDALFEWWMALVVPAVSAVAYALAWWVSTRAVPADRDETPSRL